MRSMCAKYLAHWYRNEYRDSLLEAAKLKAELRKAKSEGDHVVALGEAKFERNRSEQDLKIDKLVETNTVNPVSVFFLFETFLLSVQFRVLQALGVELENLKDYNATLVRKLKNSDRHLDFEKKENIEAMEQLRSLEDKVDDLSQPIKTNAVAAALSKTIIDSFRGDYLSIRNDIYIRKLIQPYGAFCA